MRALFILSLLGLLSVPAYAQNDLALCRLRAQHVAAADVTYKPGVDVHGNPVVPADLNAVPNMMPDVIKIPMNIDLAQRLGNVPAGMDMKSEMGMAEIHRDGRVTFNGQDLTQQAAVVCGDAPAAAVNTATQVPPPVQPASAALPPQTLGQLPLAPRPTTAAQEPQPQTPPSQNPEAPVKKDDIIWGQGY